MIRDRPAGASDGMAIDIALPTVAGVTHRQVDIGSLSIHVAEAGSGPPLLLVHGWPQHWFCWHRVVPMLADRYRLIMPDLRGHGWSDAPRRGYEKEQLATDMLRLLDRMDLDTVGYVGHDWGGWTGFLACLRAPQRFSGLVALGIVHPFQHITPAKTMQAWRGAYQLALSTPVLSEVLLRSSPQFVASMIPAAARNREAFTPAELRCYGEIFQQPARAHATTQLYRTFLMRELPRLGRYRNQRLVVPTRLVIGEHDMIGSPALLDGWQANADDMSVEVLDDVGHFIPDEAPMAVAAHVVEMFG
jgi:pimeloyl-ACP methyl ester carboxylesterase